ncbi:MAG: type II toxin-antitoxin system VapC family toxin [Dehalococcoidia bacterium]
MEWIVPLQGQLVGLDTAPIIYFIEEHPDYLPIVKPFFEAMDRGEIRAVTSVVTLLEVLVHPLRRGNLELVQQYREFLLNSSGLTCADISSDVAPRAAELRSEYNLRTPDAIQIATALNHGAVWFLTNDAGLDSIGQLSTLVLDQLRP